MIPVVIALLLPATLGFLVVTVVLSGDKGSTFAERLGLAFPAGVGLQAVQMFVLGIFRVPLTLAGMTIPLIIEIALLLFWARAKGAFAVQRLSFPLFREIMNRKTHWLRSMTMAFLLLWVVGHLSSVFYETLLRPIYAWDSWANWSAGAKHFFYSHSLLLDAPPSDWFGKSTGRYHQYPPLNTLLQVWLALWAGSFDEVLVKLWTPMLLLSFAFSLYLFAAGKISRLAGLGLVVMIISSPFIAMHGTEVYSDLAQGVFGFYAVMTFSEAMAGRKSYWVLTGLFLALTIFTKEEGLFFASPFVISALIFIFLRATSGSDRKLWLLQFLTSLALIAPWLLFRMYFHVRVGSQAFSFQYHSDVPLQILRNLSTFTNFNVIVFFFPVFVILNGKPNREILHLLLPLLAYFLFFVAIYTFAGYYDWFIRGAVFHRNILTLFPALCAVTVLLLQPLMLRKA